MSEDERSGEATGSRPWSASSPFLPSRPRGPLETVAGSGVLSLSTTQAMQFLVEDAAPLCILP